MSSFLFVLLACTPDSKPESKDDSATVMDTGDAEWGYSGDIGPEAWGSLDEDYALCSEGTAQSPIDIVGTAVTDDGLAPPEIAWAATQLNAYNSGHYIRYEVDAGSTLTWDGAIYDLAQFHFHSLSEHTLDGQHQDMEIHFVHARQDDATKLAVVAVLVTSSPDGEGGPLGPDGSLDLYAALALPESETPTELGGSVELAGNFAAQIQGDFLEYEGSLTTPPCSEGVTFFVANAPLPAAPEDIAAFQAVYSDNYRPVQALNGRGLSALRVQAE